MNKKLCGTLIIYEGIKRDYSYMESIECLKALCDMVVVVDCGSQDGTAESLKSIESEKVIVLYREKSEWDIMKGRTKLAYYTNIAIDKAAELGFEWQINLQSDEIIHEDCFDYIRNAISNTLDEGFWARRINLWGDSKNYLNVGYDRLPVGIEIIRLTKTKYKSVDDAQSIDCPARWEGLDNIRIYHVGFVRNKYIHTEKIRHMLVDVFEMGGNDPNVEAMNGVFDPWKMGFSKEDVSPISEPLPIIIQEWCKLRDEINAK